MKKKCKKGFKSENGRCIKKGISEDLNPTTKKFFGLTRNQKYGIFIIIFALLVWAFRPLQECDWWNVLCHIGSGISTPIFLIVSLILVIFGILKFLNIKIK